MRTNKEFTAFFALSGLTLIFFFPAFFLGKTFYIRDLLYIFHPWKELCAQAVQRGEMPLWDQHAYCGMPLLANWQTAVFYPFSVFFYVFNFVWALKLFHFAQLVTAGYFAYLFGKKELGSSSAAAAMMVLFAFNGFIITKLEFLSYAGVLSWTFATLLLRKNPVLLALSACISFLSGYPVFLFQMAVTAAFVLSDAFKDGSSLRFSLKPVTFFAAAAAIAAGLASCQLIPTLELMKASARSKEGIGYAVAMLHSLSPSDLLGFISPLLTKTVSPASGGEYLQWNTTVYIGIAGIILACFGLVSKNLGKVRYIGVLLAAFGAVLALGDKTPVYPWLYRNVFLFSSIRYPSQFAYLAVTGLVLLAGAGARNPKYGTLLTMLAVLELLLLSSGFQALANNDFFSHRSGLVAWLQNRPVSDRFILSPGTENNRYLKAGSIEEGWQDARGILFNLTCLPYHLNNAYGFGEPLTSYAIEKEVNRAYSMPYPSAALDAYKDLGVNYLICARQLADPSGYTQLNDRPPYVYGLGNGFPGILQFEPDDSGVNSFSFKQDINRREFDFDTDRPKNFVFKECFFPGWEFYINGEKRAFGIKNGLFPEFNVPSGKSFAFYVYRPPSFFAGLLITLMFSAGIALYGCVRLLRFIP